MKKQISFLKEKFVKWNVKGRAETFFATKLKRFVSVLVVVAIIMTSYGVSTLASSIDRVVSTNVSKAKNSEDLTTKYYEEYKFVKEQVLLLNTDNGMNEEKEMESIKADTLINDALNDKDDIILNATKSDVEDEIDADNADTVETEMETDAAIEDGAEIDADIEETLVEDATISDIEEMAVVSTDEEDSTGVVSTTSDVTDTVIDVEEIFAKATESVALTVSEDVTEDRVKYVATTSALIKSLLGVENIDTLELFQSMVDIKNEYEVKKDEQVRVLEEKAAEIKEQPLFGGSQEEALDKVKANIDYQVDLSKYGDNYVFGAGPDTYFDGFDGIKIRYKDGHMAPMFAIDEKDKKSITDEFIAYHAEDEPVKPDKPSPKFWITMAVMVVVCIACAVTCNYAFAAVGAATWASSLAGVAYYVTAYAACIAGFAAVGCMIAGIVEEVSWQKAYDENKKKVDKVRYSIKFIDWKLPIVVNDMEPKKEEWLDHKFPQNNSKLGRTNLYRPMKGYIAGVLSWVPTSYDFLESKKTLRYLYGSTPNPAQLTDKSFYNFPIVPNYWEAYNKIEQMKSAINNNSEIVAAYGSNFDLDGEVITAHQFISGVSASRLFRNMFLKDAEKIGKIKEISFGYVTTETYEISNPRWDNELKKLVWDPPTYKTHVNYPSGYRAYIEVPNSNGLLLFFNDDWTKIKICGTDPSKKIYLYENAKNIFNITGEFDGDKLTRGMSNCTFDLENLDFTYAKDLTSAFEGCGGKIIKSHWEFKEKPNCTAMFKNAQFDILRLEDFPFPANATSMFEDSHSGHVYVSKRWDDDYNPSVAKNFAKNSFLVGQNGTEASKYSDTSILARIDRGDEKPGVLWGDEFEFYPGWYYEGGQRQMPMSKITEITFDCNPNPAPTDYDEKWFLRNSAQGYTDGRFITCYRKGTKVTIYTPGHTDGWSSTGNPGVNTIEDASYLFSDPIYERKFSSLTKINNIDIINFTHATDVSHMFEGCASLSEVTIKNADRIEDTSYMFYGCNSLESIDFEYFNSRNVTTMTHMFDGCYNLTSVDTSTFDTANVTNMSYMFNNCHALPSIDLSSFNTSLVEDMTHMFFGCSSVDTLNLEKFDTRKVVDMTHMFDGCKSLTSLNLGDFSTDAVMDMKYMFANCESIENISLASFKTNNVMDMSYMFTNCVKLKSVDTTKLDASKVIDMSHMFEGCKTLETIDLSQFTEANSTVLNLAYMLSNCEGLKNVNIGNFAPSSCTSFKNLFYCCRELKTIKVATNVRNWTGTSDSSNMFFGCAKLLGGGGYPYNSSNVDGEYARLDFGGILPGYFDTDNNSIYSSVKIYLPKSYDDTITSKANIKNIEILSSEKCEAYNTVFTWEDANKVANQGYINGDTLYIHVTSRIGKIYLDSSINGYFNEFTKVQKIKSNCLDTSEVTSMSGMFAGLNDLTTIDITNFNTSSVTDMSRMFYQNYHLATISNLSFNTKNLINMSEMFYGCVSMKNLDLTSFDTSRVTNMSGLFKGCVELETLKHNFNTKKVINMSSMFEGCSVLQEIDLSGFDTSAATNMSAMFKGCKAVLNLDLSGFVTILVTDMSHMFEGCEKITELNLEAFYTSRVKDISGMFNSCLELRTIYVSDNFVEEISGTNVFSGSTKLKGGMGTEYDSSMVSGVYARVDKGTTKPGYFTNSFVIHKGDILKNITTTRDTIYDVIFWGYPNTIDDVPLNSPSLSGYTLTSGWEDKGVISGTRGLKVYLGNKLYNSSTNKAHETIVIYAPGEGKIMVDSNASSFFKPSSSYAKISQICGLDLLDTRNVTDMSYMFMDVANGNDGYQSIDTSLGSINTLILGKTSDKEDIQVVFDTANVTTMKGMFQNSNFKEINILGLDTGNVKDTSYMFNNMTNLTTIKSKGFSSLSGITSSSYMFTSDENLVGGRGTRFADYRVEDKTYARVDAQPSYPGYFTYEVEAAYIFRRNWYNASERLLPQSGIKTITFEAYPNSAPASYDETWTLTNSNYGTDDGIYLECYTVGDEIIIYAPAKKDVYGNVIPVEPRIYAEENCYNMFSGDYRNLERINNLDKLKFDYTTSTEAMFMNCYSLKSLDFGENNGSNITNVSYMFNSCTSLIDLDMSKFEIRNVSNVSMMFSNCNALETLKIDGLDVKNVTSLSNMFNNCKKLKKLDISHFDTSNVKYMSYMFSNCNSLESLDVSGFDTSNVTSMTHMFNECRSLKELDLSSFSASSVTDLASMFYNCKSLKKLTFPSSFTTSKVYSMYKMFYNCESLESLDLSMFSYAGFSKANTDAQCDFSEMFYNCHSLKSLNISNMGTSKIKKMSYMFYNCSSLEDLNLASLDFSNVTDTSYMFASCSNIKSLNIPNLSNNNVSNMSHMFEDCEGLESLPANSINTINVTDMSYMLRNMKKLKDIDIMSWRVENVTNTTRMFENCISLTTIYGGAYEFTNVTTANSQDMFRGCENLVGGANTIYTEEHVDVTYAIADEGVSKPGYFTFLTSAFSYVLNTGYKSFLSDGVTDVVFWQYPDTIESLPLNSNIPEGFTLIDANWTKVTDEIPGSNGLQLYTGNVYKNSDNKYHRTMVIYAPKPFRVVADEYLYGMFYSGSSNKVISQIVGFDKVDTSNVTQMGDGFRNVGNGSDGYYSVNINIGLEPTLDLKQFDTSSVVNMVQLFSGVVYDKIDFTNFNTSSATDMQGMFYSITTSDLDLTSFDTSNVTNMESMFENAVVDYDIDFSSFNTEKVRTMEKMFSGSSLKDVDLTSFDVTKVRYMEQMFYKCLNLKTLNLASFNTSESKYNLTNMFSYDTNLKTIYASDAFVVSNDYVDLFYNCYSLEGGNGTKYIDIVSFKDKSMYAKIDKPGQKGYFTEKILTPDVTTSGHIHLACGHAKTCEHGHLATYSYVELDSSVINVNDFINGSGKYAGTPESIYLSRDVELNGGSITLYRDVFICLNGYSIKGTFETTDKTVTITNCGKNQSTITSDNAIFDSAYSYVYGNVVRGRNNIIIDAKAELYNADESGFNHIYNADIVKNNASKSLVKTDTTTNYASINLLYDNVTFIDNVAGTDQSYYIDNDGASLMFRDIKVQNLTNAYSFIHTKGSTQFVGTSVVSNNVFTSDKPTFDFDGVDFNIRQATISITNNTVNADSIIKAQGLRSTAIGMITISNNVLNRTINKNQAVIMLTGSGQYNNFSKLVIENNKIVGVNVVDNSRLSAFDLGNTEMIVYNQPIFIRNNKAYSDTGSVESTIKHMVGLRSNKTSGFMHLSNVFNLNSRIDSIAISTADGTGIISSSWGAVSDRSLANVVFTVDRYLHDDIVIEEDSAGRLLIAKGHSHMICGEKATTSACIHTSGIHSNVDHMYEKLTTGVANSDIRNYLNGKGKYAGFTNYIALDKDILITGGSLTLERDLYICLNGHSITGSFVNAGGNNYKVYITNCSSHRGVIYSHADTFANNVDIEVYGKEIVSGESAEKNISIEVDNMFSNIVSGAKFTYLYNVNIDKIGKKTLIKYDVAANLVRTEIRPDVKLENVTLENEYTGKDAEAFVKTDFDNLIEINSSKIENIENAPVLVDARYGTLNFEGDSVIKDYKVSTSSMIKVKRMDVSEFGSLDIRDNTMPVLSDIDQSLIKAGELYAYGDLSIKNNNLVEQGNVNNKILSALTVDSIKVYSTPIDISGNRVYTSTMTLSNDHHMYGIYSTITDNTTPIFEFGPAVTPVQFNDNSRFDSIAFASTTGEGVIIKDWTSTTAANENMYGIIFKADTYKDNELVVKKDSSNNVLIAKETAFVNLDFKATIYANGGTFTQGTLVKEEDVRLGSDIRGFEIPRRDGYKFLGFEVATGSTMEMLGDVWPYSGSASVYASWSNIKYTIRYVSNGATGKNSMPDKPMIYDKKERLDVMGLAREGYGFDGWVMSDGTELGNRARVSNLTKVDGDIVYLKAKWKGQPYTIRYIYRDKNSEEILTDSATFGDNHSLRVAPFYKPGYTFVGWSTVPNGDIVFADGAKVGNSIKYASPLNLYAQWIKNDVKDRMYYVIHGNDGQVAYAPEMTLYLNERSKIILPKLERQGYEFIGFTTDKEGNNPYIVPKWPDFEGRKDIYAQWKVKSYDVVYHSNNGEYSLATESKTHDAKVTVMDNIYSWTKPGYTFDGWSSESKAYAEIFKPNVQYDELTMEDKIDLYARWKKLSANISYNSNGGTGNMLDETFTYGNADILSANAFERPLYVFSGWSTNSSDTTPMYIDGSDVDRILLDNSNKANITLYAIWTEETNAVNVFYNLRDGYIGNSSRGRLVKVPNGSKFFKVEAKKKGYNQLDYTDSINATVTEDVTINGDTVVTANWNEKTYRVVYDGRGGTPNSLIAGGIYNWSDPFDIPTNLFVKNGYNLLGFDTEPIADNARYSATARGVSMLTDEEEIRLYAVWSGKSYYIRYNSDGGNGSIVNKNFTYGAKVGLDDNIFKKDGYTTQKFRYTNSKNETMYFSSSELVDSSVFDVPASGYVDLYAEYQKKVSVVNVSTTEGTFDDGSKEYEKVYAYGDAVSLEEPKAGNQIFKGYELNIDEATTSDIDSHWKSEAYTANVKDKPWDKQKYNIYLHNDVNGHVDSLENVMFDEPINLDEFSNVKEDTRILKGWACEDHFYEKDAVVSDLGSIFGDEVHLHAVWEEKSEPYTLELAVQQYGIFSGTWWKDYIYFKNLNKDSKLKVNYSDYTDSGIDFYTLFYGYEAWGWFNNDGKMEYPPNFELTRDDTRKATVSITLNYIKSANIKYHITYKGNMGLVAGQNSITIPCTESSGPVEPVPYYQGAEFDGWVDMSTGMDADFEKIAREKKDVTLTATWRLSKNLGLVLHPTDGVTHNEELTNYVSRYLFIFNPSERYGINIPNHHFKYWSNTPDGRGDKYYTTDRFEKIMLAGYDTIHLYGIWEGDEMKVSYHANGGLRVATPQVCHYDNNERLKRNNFIRPGYVFAGWSTSSAPDAEVKYYDKASVDDLYAKEGYSKEIKLYAVWIPESDSVQVVYKGNEGKIHGQSTYAINVKKGDKFTPLTASRTGMTCVGYKDESGVDYTKESIVNDSIIVIAQWSLAPKDSEESEESSSIAEPISSIPSAIVENDNSTSAIREIENSGSNDTTSQSTNDIEQAVLEKAPVALESNSLYGSRISNSSSTSGGSISGSSTYGNIKSAISNEDVTKLTMPYLNEKAELTNGSWNYDPILNTWSYQIQQNGKVELAKNGWYHITNLAGENLWYKFNEYGIMELGVVEDENGMYYIDDNPLNLSYGSLKSFEIY